MGKILKRAFYAGSDILQISKNLLGKKLVSTIAGKRTTGMIVETEAYKAPEDKASHAFGNKRTVRTKTMFAPPGTVYVYICYGIHHLLNVVTADEGIAHVILIRAIEPIEGLTHMESRRNMSAKKKELCNGPGKFTRAMGISKALNDHSLLDKQHGLWIEHFQTINKTDIMSGPRVGMATAEECSNWPWRFRVKNNPWTSKPDTVWYEKYW